MLMLGTNSLGTCYFYVTKDHMKGPMELFLFAFCLEMIALSTVQSFHGC